MKMLIDLISVLRKYMALKICRRNLTHLIQFPAHQCHKRHLSTAFRLYLYTYLKAKVDINHYSLFKNLRRWLDLTKNRTNKTHFFIHLE